MTTVAYLADRIQDVLGDAGEATWTQAQIEAWVEDALKEYAVLFVEVADDVEKLELEAGTYQYELPDADMTKGVYTLEFPQGESPPNYYMRKSYKDPDFWGGEYYDLLGNGDVMIGDPGSGGLATVLYSRYLDHQSIGPGIHIAVPTYHDHLLVLYVRWVAWINLASREMQNPTSNSSLLMAQMNQNSHVARSEYLAAVKLALEAELDDSARVRWQDAGGFPSEIY